MSMAIPLEVPYPEEPAQIELLLQRYLSLYKCLEDPNIVEKNKIRIELNAIEKLLSRISNESDKHVSQCEEVSKIIENNIAASKIKKANKYYDIELLNKQIIGFNLLAKDLDLPDNLQIDFGLNSEYNDEQEPVDEDGSLKLNESELSPIQIDHTNFETRFENFLPKELVLNKKQDVYHTVVGNKFAELKISNKIMERVNQLESIPANIGTIDSEELFQKFYKSEDEKFDNVDALKIKSLIELKSLKLLAKQKSLRHNFMNVTLGQSHDTDETLKNNSTVLLARRLSNLRMKIIAPQTARLAEQLEEQRKRELKNKQYQIKLSKLRKKLEAINDLLFSQAEVRNTRTLFFQKNLANFHHQAEKEAAKRLERTAKERLQALKSNDEEAYLKLLDQTKDTRITHLLKQTNSFLDSLAKAVTIQQRENSDHVVKSLEDLSEEDREKIDYYNIAHRVKEKITKQPSILVGGTLKEYQIKGLEWMVSLYNNHLNGILADEMGLGKTIQSISLITYLYEVKKETQPFLVIVPLSTMTNWTIEFEKWAPSMKKIVYKGTPNQRKLLAHEVKRGDFSILLTTYEYIIKDRSVLSKLKWAHMIIDEGHRMKNAQSKLSFTLTNFYHTKNRLILTGTPLQNNLPELWALLNFVLPKIFNSVKTFDEWFNTPFANTGTGEKLELSEEESLLIIRRLHKVLRPFLLRRLKKDVEKDLPDKVEKVVKCKFSGLQHALYQQMLKHNALFVGSSINNGTTKSGIKGLNNKIMQLRKICNHPFVFEEVEDLINPTRFSNDFLWRVSGKFELLDRVLPKFKRTNHRVLIFFQMTSVMDIMEDYLRYRDMKYLRLDGGTKADERQDMLKAFNKPDSDIFAFLLSTRAGGLGLNLQTADTVIIFDTDWNPHQDLQAQDRAHRIGQKNEVRILRLITNDSVEEVILERAHQKLNIDGKVIQAGKFDNKSTAEEQEAFLRRLLEAEESKKRGGEDEDGNFDDDELNEILARSEDEKVLFKEMDAERNAKDQAEGGYSNRLITKEELPDVFSEDMIEKQLNKEIKENSEELGRTRVRKQVMYDDGLTEEQWLDAMDDDEMTVEDAIKKKRESMARRKEKKLNQHDGDSNGRGDRKRKIRSSSKKYASDNESPESSEVEESEAEFSDDEHASKKNKSNGNSKEVDPKIREKAEEVINTLMELKDENDAEFIDLFLKLPSKKMYPDYYQIIENPISLNEIKRKLKKDEYSTYDEFVADLKLMVSNAQTYNEPGSYVYNCSEKIGKII